MAEIDILLASYNGEKYIAEQLDSLLAQTFKDFRILIRDDGSTDRTPEIIEEYARKYPGIIEVVHDDAVCKYHAKNFFQLIKYATADYVMFCDQDDYWLKYKIEITRDYMKNTEKLNPNKGVLIFTGLQLVDEKLQDLDRFFCLGVTKKSYSLHDLVMKTNCVAGCTIMINRRIYENLGDYSDCINYHDHWIAMYASAYGVVQHIPMALMLYRQHNDQAIGGISRPRSAMSLLKQPVKNTIETIRKYHRNFSVSRHKYIEFRQRYSDVHQSYSILFNPIQSYSILFNPI